ncbi:MAG: primosomal protein N' [Desulfobacteraceae bacterium]|nr:primosomal protein N' [Desulfobacteraceae bacterium]MBC2757505.1 primosomal protein N' [Desulfobacteraceae bacterium]
MTDNYPYIEVAVTLPVFNTYTYAVPEPLQEIIAPGKRVLIPFGKRKITGYVLGSTKNSDIQGIKNIIEILDEIPLFPSSMIPFFKWISDYYIHPMGEVIKEALPGGINLNECISVHITECGTQWLDQKKAAPLENDILCVLSSDACRLQDISKKLNRKVPNSLICKMEKNGLLCRKREINKPVTRQKMQRYITRPETGIPDEKLSVPKQKILETAAEYGEISVSELKKIIPTAASHIRKLEQNGLISIFSKPVYRDPFGESVSPDHPPKLTLDQQHVVSNVVKNLGNGFSAFLLAGVTGSGKTEVYMHATAQTIKKKLSVLVLVPEIALVSEIERRFRARFGECVAVLHSGLSAGERFDQWIRISNRQCPIVIGARSAIFAPLTNIGLIIVDEEHDTSYKQESRFRYNARDMAIIRARQEGAIALLGSATPSVQSVHNVANKKFNELSLQNRVFLQTLPDIHVVDLRKHKDYRGTRRFITIDLQKAIKETLDRKEQVLLFLNRRGFASYPVCAGCGEALKCRNCDITLTLHQKDKAYKCHLCGYSLPSVAACSNCGSTSIKRLGMGTEKIETTIKGLFPQARVARMDRDTVTRKGALVKLLKGLRNHETDILIGTQMVAKGHDFPNITLVGIICADLSLSFPDFRAGELTFQVLAQVAGRAGRGNRPGRVILQTYNPEHFSITAATDHDFMKFYNQEISFRKTFKYPPFSRMIQLKISGRDREKTRQQSLDIGKMCNSLKKENSDYEQWIDILGPIEAPLTRVANRFRWQLLIKSQGVDLLHRFVRTLIFENGLHLSGHHVKVAIDVDPFFMM